MIPPAVDLDIMEHARVWTEILDTVGLSASEFMRSIGGDPSTFSQWRNGTNSPTPRFVRAIEELHGIRLVRDGTGRVVGSEKVSAVDIDIRNNSSDIPNQGISEQDMIERYETIARSVGAPHWEDLEDEKRAAIRAEMVLERLAIERLTSLTTETMIRIALKRRD